MCRRLPAVLASLLLVSCQALSPTPTPEQMASADYGPKPGNELIRAYVETNAADPKSISQFSTSEPGKCGKKKGLGTPVYGWCLTYEYSTASDSDKSSHNVMVFRDKVIFEDGFFVTQEEPDLRTGIRIGMTKAEVLASKWGAPSRKNVTTTKDHVTEQWVYRGSQYLYFEDGVLTSIQQSE
jgi:hypothetical protein